MPTKPDDGTFLSRWSRRKQAETIEPPAEQGMEQEGEHEPEQPLDENLTDEELLAELDLPDPDTMKADDDFSAFMRARVPERLRRRALRTLWRSNPVLANLDELVDYGEDYTDAACVVENMQTVYEVGKGAAEKWKRHVAALAAAAEEDDGEGEIAETAETPPAVETPPESPPEAPLPQRADPPVTPVEVAEAPAPAPRHMRFRFD